MPTTRKNRPTSNWPAPLFTTSESCSIWATPVAKHHPYGLPAQRNSIKCGADKNAQWAKAKNVKRIKTAVMSFSALAAKDAQQEWERFAEAPNVDTWHAVYVKAFPLFRDYRIKRRNRGTPSNVEKESWHSWNLSKNERYLKYLGERNAITHPVKWGKPTVWNSDYLRVWRWHKSVCRSCVFYELVLKCLLEPLLEPFQLLLELKLLRSAINPKQNDQPNRCTTLRVFSND